MVESPVNLLGLSVFSEKPSQNSLPPDPKDFGRHSAFHSTSAFTSAAVIAFALGLKVESSTGAGVDYLLSLHDQPVLDEFADEDSGIRLADLLELVGVHPDTLLSALEHL